MKPSKTFYASLKKFCFFTNKFKSDNNAVAAVEFALIAPILILLFIGTVEISLAISINRKVARISSAVADLVTQSPQLTANEVNQIIQIAEKIMYPYDNQVNITLTGIEIAGGNATSKWVCNGSGCISGGSPQNVPAAIRKDGSFLVSSVVSTNHEPIVGFFNYSNGGLTDTGTTWQMQEEMFLRPRIGNNVCIAGTGAGC